MNIFTATYQTYTTPRQYASEQAENHTTHPRTTEKISSEEQLTGSGQTTEERKDFRELTPEQLKTVRELKLRDAEVRAHEQAHAAVGGQYAGAPQYDYQTGPDGKKYAVGGEVSIDVSEASKPEATIQKMQVVKRAAMAPAEPSAQDYKVAAEATLKEQKARLELSQQQPEVSGQSTNRESPKNAGASAYASIANVELKQSNTISVSA